MTVTIDLYAALLRFRELIAQGHEPESAFLLAHGHSGESASILESADAAIKKMLDTCAEMRATLDHSDAILVQMRALFA